MDLLEILSKLGGVAVAAGLLLAFLQLRSDAHQRQEEIALRLYSPFFDPAFSRSYWQVSTWEYTTFEQFDANATVDERAALNVVRILFETMGLLYKRGLANIDFLADLMASPTILTWNTIAPIVYGYREKAHAPDWSRWHEELAVALDHRLTALGRAHPAILPPTRSVPAPTGE